MAVVLRLIAGGQPPALTSEEWQRIAELLERALADFDDPVTASAWEKIRGLFKTSANFSIQRRAPTATCSPAAKAPRR